MNRFGVVLVTGVRGFVGPHLVAGLGAGGARVWGLGPEPDAGAIALDGWCRADVREPDQLAAAIRTSRPDIIVHLAAQSSAAASFHDAAGTFEINTLGTWRLLEAVRREAPHARTVIVGTGEVYGPQPAGTRVGEDAAFRPVSPYALSKAAADAAAEVAGRSYQLDIVRVRPFGHVGPGQSARFVLPAFAQQIAAIEAGHQAPVMKVGNLDVVRDLTDVRDVVGAYLALIEHGVPGTAYNICRGEGLRLADLAEGLLRRASVPVRLESDPARMRPADVPYLVGDPTRLAAATGWAPSITIDRTLDDVLAEWRRAGGVAPATA